MRACAGTVPVLAAAAAAVGMLAWSGGCGNGEPSGLATVRRGPLEVTLRLSGTLRPTSEQTVKSPRWGEILRIVPHGSTVRAGDVILELDSGDAENSVREREIEVEVAEVELRQAEKETAKSVRQAAMRLEAAGMSREMEELRLAEIKARPTERELLEARSRLELAKALLEAARESRGIVADLVRQGFAAAEELRAAELELARAQADLASAAAGLAATEALPDKADVEEAELRVKAARLAEEAAAKGVSVSAEVAESRLGRFRRDLEREKDGLAAVRRSLKEFSVAAPNDGVVVYVPRPWGGSWRPGQSVWQGASLMSIPRLSRMKVTVQVPAGDIETLELASRPPARISVPALGGRTFPGRVTWVSATGQDEFERLDPSTAEKLGRAERQVFEAEIELDEECADLRPGFEAQVEIVLSSLDDAVIVPLTALRQTARSRPSPGKPAEATVRVWRDGRVELRRVRVLASDGFDAAVEGALAAGDRLCTASGQARDGGAQ